MSEPTPPDELWGVWSDEHDVWLANADLTFAFFGSRKLAEHRRKTTPGVEDWRVVPVPSLDAPPAPADESTPLGILTHTSNDGILLSFSTAALHLKRAGYLVMSPEEIKERTG